MKFSFSIERIFPHAPEKVWASITDARALGVWLMETDFRPELDAEFRLHCVDDAGHRDIYLCRVLELNRPRRMVWSWVLDAPGPQGEMTVEFDLEPLEGGTKLTITHRGENDEDAIENFKGGWPTILDALRSFLEPAV